MSLGAVRWPREILARHPAARYQSVKVIQFGRAKTTDFQLKTGQIAIAETLVLEGITASIGSVGDTYDNTLAETAIGLFKTDASLRAAHSDVE